MWCWRRIEKIRWTDLVKNEEVLQRVKGQRNILHTVKRRKVNWNGHILGRNCLLKHVVEGKVQGRGRRGRRRQQILYELNEGREEDNIKNTEAIGR
jgi:hypothetical protein